MNIAVFAYGTLQIPEVMAAVTGQDFRGLAATLEGYSRHRLRDKSYPGIRPQAGAFVDGLLYQGLDIGTLARLDEFEDDFYQRQTLNVVTCRDTSVAAQVYVVEAQYYGLLEDVPWNLHAFRQQSLIHFLDQRTGSTSGSPTAPLTREL